MFVICSSFGQTILVKAVELCVMNCSIFLYNFALLGKNLPETSFTAFSSHRLFTEVDDTDYNIFYMGYLSPLSKRLNGIYWYRVSDCNLITVA